MVGLGPSHWDMRKLCPAFGPIWEHRARDVLRARRNWVAPSTILCPADANPTSSSVSFLTKGGRRCAVQLSAAARRLILVAAFVAGGSTTSLGQDVLINFDTTGPTSDAELDAWFDFFGIDTPLWVIDPNTGSHALERVRSGSKPLEV